MSESPIDIVMPLDELVNNAIKSGDELVEIHPAVLKRLVQVARNMQLLRHFQCQSSEEYPHVHMSRYYLDKVLEPLIELESDLLSRYYLDKVLEPQIELKSDL